MNIGKYEFISSEQAETKIEALGVDSSGEATHSHAIVRLGNIILENEEYDEEGNIKKDIVLSDKYHLDVLWVGLEDHPYGWKSYAVSNIIDNGIHHFSNMDYINYKFN